MIATAHIEGTLDGRPSVSRIPPKDLPFCFAEIEGMPIRATGPLAHVLSEKRKGQNVVVDGEIQVHVWRVGSGAQRDRMQINCTKVEDE